MIFFNLVLYFFEQSCSILSSLNMQQSLSKGALVCKGTKSWWIQTVDCVGHNHLKFQLKCFFSIYEYVKKEGVHIAIGVVRTAYQKQMRSKFYLCISKRHYLHFTLRSVSTLGLVMSLAVGRPKRIEIPNKQTKKLYIASQLNDSNYVATSLANIGSTIFCHFLPENCQTFGCQMGSFSWNLGLISFGNDDRGQTSILHFAL